MKKQLMISIKPQENHIDNSWLTSKSDATEIVKTKKSITLSSLDIQFHDGNIEIIGDNQNMIVDGELEVKIGNVILYLSKNLKNENQILDKNVDGNSFNQLYDTKDISNKTDLKKSALDKIFYTGQYNDAILPSHANRNDIMKSEQPISKVIYSVEPINEESDILEELGIKEG